MTFGSLDGGEDREYNGINFFLIFKKWRSKTHFSLEQKHLTEFSYTTVDLQLLISLHSSSEGEELSRKQRRSKIIEIMENEEWKLTCS